MKIVIELSDETYKDIKEENGIYGINNGLSARITGKVVGAIQSGTPLPKGHGDLITKGQAIELVEFYQINPQHFNFVNLIDEIKDEKPIIEADKSEREDKG